MSNVADKIKADTEEEIARVEKYLGSLKSLQKALNSSRKKRKYTKKNTSDNSKIEGYIQPKVEDIGIYTTAFLDVPKKKPGRPRKKVI
jgi:alanyl-tRNA synthetase